MLVEHTLFGRVDKVQIAIDRIRQFEPPEGYYVAFSGGKDSVVVLDLIKRAGVKYDAHYNLTTVDPPELVQFIRREHPEVENHLPKETMWKLIVRKADLPTRKARWCCHALKEGGGTGRTVITGVRWAESIRRAKRKMIEACNQSAKHLLNPIIDWTNYDVWQYIHENNIPYCSLYDEGFKRLGCVLCPMSNNKNRKREAARWPKFVEVYRQVLTKAFPAMIARKQAKGIAVTWESAEDWLQWYINTPDRSKNPDQTVMFE
jgi:phosphoadenosine phosphosulfate reductase